MGSLIFSIIKLKIKLKTFKPPRVRKEWNVKNSESQHNHPTSPSSVQAGHGKDSAIQEQRSGYSWMRQWSSEKAFCRPKYVTRSEQATCVICSFNMSCVICCWNILQKNKWSSSAFQWNSGVWNRTKRAGSGQRHPCYMEGAGKDGERGYRGCVKDLHSELPASHQSDKARGLKEAKCGHLIHM